MGGRKRKKVVRRLRKTIPKIFACPNCGEKTLGIDIDRETNEAIIKCGRCQIEDVVKISNVEQAVDAYGKFVDKYYNGDKAVIKNEESGDVSESKDR
ncbi:MAG TPA: hypothetical protein PKX17_02575 [Candidatus Methanomethylicus sp.]|nr:hypothetical protein [Candidatus Methanomethylicus sp.]